MTWPEEHSFWVSGTPIPQGSKSVSRSGHLYESNPRHKAWRQKVEAAARAENIQFGDRPVEVHMVFYFTPPQRPKFSVHAVKPDVDKLARSVNDSLTRAGMIQDDARIVFLTARKRYADNPGAIITIRSIE